MEEKKPIYIDNAYDYREELMYISKKDRCKLILNSLYQTVNNNTSNIAKNSQFDKNQQNAIDSMKNDLKGNEKLDSKQAQQIAELSASTENNANNIGLLASNLAELTDIVSSLGVDELSGDIQTILDTLDEFTDAFDELKSDVGNIRLETTTDSGYTTISLYVGDELRGSFDIPDNLYEELQEEIDNRIEKDNELRILIESEASERERNDNSLENMLDREKERATDAEDALWDAISGLSETVDDIASEIGNIDEIIESAKTEIEEDILDDISGLTNAIEEVKDDLNNEINERISSDENIENLIDSLRDEMNTKFDEVTSAATELSEFVDDLSDTLEQKINDVEDKIIAEQNRAESEENRISEFASGISQALDDEIARAIAKEEELDEKIDERVDEESLRAIAKENELLELIENQSAQTESLSNDIDSLSAQLQEEITNRTNADNEFNSALDNLLTEIGQLSVSVVTNAQGIAENQDRIDALEDDVETCENSINNLIVSAQTNADNINVLQGDVSRLESEISTKLGVSEFEAYSAATNNRIAALESADTEMLNTIRTISGELKSSVDLLADEIESAQNDIDALQSNVSSLETRVSANENAITELTENYNSVRVSVAEVANAMNELRLFVNSIEERVESLERIHGFNPNS